MTTLYLNLKKEYFDQIKSGIKKEEYREIKPYWTVRLNKQHDSIMIILGRPKQHNENNSITFPWKGYEIKTITHPLFGNKPTEVYAIKLEKD